MCKERTSLKPDGLRGISAVWIPERPALTPSLFTQSHDERDHVCLPHRLRGTMLGSLTMVYTKAQCMGSPEYSFAVKLGSLDFDFILKGDVRPWNALPWKTANAPS